MSSESADPSEEDRFAAATAEQIQSMLAAQPLTASYSVGVQGAFPATQVRVTWGFEGWIFELFLNEAGTAVGDSLTAIQRLFPSFSSSRSLAASIVMDVAEGWPGEEATGPDEAGVWWVRR